jgi:hypothetical protein
MTNPVLEYIQKILTEVEIPEDQLKMLSEHIFIRSLEKTLSEIVSPAEMDEFTSIANTQDVTKFNEFMSKLPIGKFQGIFVLKLQETFKSLFESILSELNPDERNEFISKLQKIANQELTAQLKDVTPEEFLKRISQK